MSAFTVPVFTGDGLPRCAECLADANLPEPELRALGIVIDAPSVDHAPVGHWVPCECGSDIAIAAPLIGGTGVNP